MLEWKGRWRYESQIGSNNLLGGESGKSIQLQFVSGWGVRIVPVHESSILLKNNILEPSDIMIRQHLQGLGVGDYRQMDK